MTDNERGLCAATAAWLNAGRVLAAWGLALSALALAGCAALVMLGTPDYLPLGALAAWALVVAAGLAERVLAMRLQFDAALFDALAQGRIGHLGGFGGLDAGLAALGLRTDTGDTRPLDVRLSGALQLLRWHRSAVVLQCVLWLVAIGCLR
ncbi:MAG: hypothetical protein V4505_27730 [Pseudomonadota bacterium]